MAQYADLKEEAGAVVRQYIERGRGAESAVKLYSDSGVKYEQYVAALNYGGPGKTAEVVAELLKDNFDVKILDIGAGTGLAALELFKLGYRNIDAVDAAEGLLEVAKERQIYGRIVCQFVGREPMPFEDDSYDVAVTCGTIGENHIPQEAFRDIIRVVKPGGYVVLVFRAEGALVPWYKEGLETYLLQLENEGLWTLQFRTIFPNYFDEKEGLVLVHKVL